MKDAGGHGSDAHGAIGGKIAGVARDKAIAGALRDAKRSGMLVTRQGGGPAMGAAQRTLLRSPLYGTPAENAARQLMLAKLNASPAAHGIGIEKATR